MKTETVTRYVGNCQICEGDFKLDDGRRMVHHGYKRPGYGRIVGDCPGVHEVPYETSCELVKSYLVGERSYLKERREWLRQIEAGEITSFVEHVRVGRWPSKETEAVTRTWTGPAPVEGATQAEWYRYFDFARVRDTELGDVRYQVSQSEAEIARLMKRIKNWVAKPVRTVEEEARAEQAVRDAARAEREAARAAREAKKSATRSKQDALKARRQAEYEAFEDRIIAAAALPEAERPAAVAELRRVRHLGKNAWMWDHHPGKSTAAVLALGIGHQNSHGTWLDL